MIVRLDEVVALQVDDVAKYVYVYLRNDTHRHEVRCLGYEERNTMLRRFKTACEIGVPWFDFYGRLEHD